MLIKKIKKLDTHISLEDMNKRNKDTLAETLGIEYTELTEDYLIAKMPVDKRTFQPVKLLNGGASLALAETVGSMAANLVIDREKYIALGMDINANHVRSAKSGFVYGKALPIHVGTQSQVWQIEISDDENQLVCLARLTMSIINRPPEMVL